MAIVRLTPTIRQNQALESVRLTELSSGSPLFRSTFLATFLPTWRTCLNKAPDATWSDEQLVELFRTGHELAFAELVRRYQVRVFRILLGVVQDGRLAEEVAQQVFVKAALRIEELDDGEAFYAWLLAVARKAALDELRKRKLRGAQPHNREPLETQATKRGEDLEASKAVRNVLDQLAPDERMALVMAEMQGLSMKEVSVALGVSQSAAKLRVKRARDHFRELFVEQTR